jgi:hypothetical protein
MDFLEEQAVLGVFTHRVTYLPALLESKRRFMPEIPLFVQVGEGTIQQNMTRLYNTFLRSRYRFWVFLDDDIEFLCPDILRNALRTHVANSFGITGVYSTFDPLWRRTSYDASQLQVKRVSWVPGYFMLVDRETMGDVKPDQEMPGGNTALDTTYCMQAHRRGLRIGLSPDVVYHVQKQVLSNPVEGRVVNEYVWERWGMYYFEQTTYQGCVLEWGNQ